MDKSVGTPRHATWDAEERAWVVVTLDAEGRRQGPAAYWRENGSFLCLRSYVNDVLNGPSLRFNENGGIVERVTYEDGQPVRPEGVPTEAFLQGDSWLSGELKSPGVRRGTWKTWSLEGTLLEESNYNDNGELDGLVAQFHDNGNPWVVGFYRAGHKQGTHQEFDENGRLLAERNFEEGLEEGPAKEWYEDGHFDFAGAILASGELQGFFHRGVWELRDSTGQLLWCTDFGIPFRAEAEDMVAFWQLRDGGADDFQERLLNHYRELMKKREHGTALLFLVRACSAADQYDELRKFLKKCTWPLQKKTADQLAETIEQHGEDCLASLKEDFKGAFGDYYGLVADAILGGAAASAALLQVAVTLDEVSESPLAREFIRCAMALEPENGSLHYTAGRIAMNCGYRVEAANHAAAIEVIEPDQAAMLHQYLSIAFRPFEFSSQWVGDSVELPRASEPSQLKVTLSPEQINARLAESYAWLQLLREMLSARVLRSGAQGTESWMIPDFSSWAGTAEAEALRERAHSFASHGIPELLREARKTWSFIVQIGLELGMDQPGWVSAVEAEDFGFHAAQVASAELYLRDLANDRTSSCSAFLYLGKPVSEWQAYFVRHWVAAELEGVHAAFAFLSGEAELIRNVETVAA